MALYYYVFTLSFEVLLALFCLLNRPRALVRQKRVRVLVGVRRAALRVAASDAQCWNAAQRLSGGEWRSGVAAAPLRTLHTCCARACHCRLVSPAGGAGGVRQAYYGLQVASSYSLLTFAVETRAKSAATPVLYVSRGSVLRAARQPAKQHNRTPEKLAVRRSERAAFAL